MLVVLSCLFSVVLCQSSSVYVRVLNRLFVPSNPSANLNVGTQQQFTNADVAIKMRLQADGVNAEKNVTATSVSSNTLSDYFIFNTEGRSSVVWTLQNGNAGVFDGILCQLSNPTPGNTFYTVEVRLQYNLNPDTPGTCQLNNNVCALSPTIVNADTVSVTCAVVQRTLGARECATSETLFTRFDAECGLRLQDKTTTLALPQRTIFRDVPTAALAATGFSAGAGSLNTNAVVLEESVQYDLVTCDDSAVLASLATTRRARQHEVLTSLGTPAVRAFHTGFLTIVNGAYRTGTIPSGGVFVSGLNNTFVFGVYQTATVGNGDALIFSGTVQPDTATASIELREGTYSVRFFANNSPNLVATTALAQSTPLVTQAVTIGATRDSHQAIVLRSAAGGNNAVEQTAFPTATLVDISAAASSVLIGETQYTLYNFINGNSALSLFDSNEANCDPIQNTVQSKVAVGSSVTFSRSDLLSGSTLLVQKNANSRRAIGDLLASYTLPTGAASGRIDNGCFKKALFVLGRDITFPQLATQPGICTASGGASITCGNNTVPVTTKNTDNTQTPVSGVTIVSVDIDSCSCNVGPSCPSNPLLGQCDLEYLLEQTSGLVQKSSASLSGAISRVSGSVVNALRPALDSLGGAVDDVADDVEDILDDGIEDIEDAVDNAVDDQKDQLDDIEKYAKDASKQSRKNKSIGKAILGDTTLLVANITK